MRTAHSVRAGLYLESLDWNIDWSIALGYRIYLEKHLNPFLHSNTQLCHVAIYLVILS